MYIENINTNPVTSTSNNDISREESAIKNQILSLQKKLQTISKETQDEKEAEQKKKEIEQQISQLEQKLQALKHQSSTQSGSKFTDTNQYNINLKDKIKELGKGNYIDAYL